MTARRTFLASALTGLVATLGLLGGAAVLVDPPGKCPDGYLPATNPTVGGACFPTDAVLPDGFRFDPGGNQGLPT